MTSKRARWSPLFITFLSSSWLVTSVHQVLATIYVRFFYDGIPLRAFLDEVSQPRLTPCVLLNLSFCGLYEKVNWPGLPRSWFLEWIFRQAGQPTFSYKPQNGKKYASFSIYRNWFCGLTTGAPNDAFLLNALKTLFRLSRVLSNLQKCILSGAKR